MDDGAGSASAAEPTSAPERARWQVEPPELRRALAPYVAGKEHDLPYLVVGRTRASWRPLDELLGAASLDWRPPESPPEPDENPGPWALEPCTRSHAERVLVRAFRGHLTYRDARLSVEEAVAVAALLVGHMPPDTRWSTNTVLEPGDGPVDEIHGWASVSPCTFDLAVVGTSADLTLAALDVDED